MLALTNANISCFQATKHLQAVFVLVVALQLANEETVENSANEPVRVRFVFLFIKEQKRASHLKTN